MKRRMVVLFVICGVLGAAVLALFLYAGSRTPPRRGTEVIRAELMAALDALEAERHPRPPLFLPATEGVAADHYRAAVDAWDSAYEGVDEDVADEVDLALTEWTGPHEPVPAEFELLLPVAREIASALRRGACAPEAGQLTQVRSGLTGSDEELEPIWSSGRIRLLARLLAAHHAENGRSADAMELLLAFGRFGADFGHGGDTFACRIGMGFQSLAIADLAALVESGALGREERRTLRGHLCSWWADPPDRAAVVRAENLYIQRMYQQTADREDGTEIFGEDIHPVVGRDDLYRIVDLIVYTAGCIPESAESDLFAYWDILSEKSSEISKWLLLSGRPGTGGVYFSMSRMWRTGFDMIEDALRRLQDRKAGLLIALDLLDYREEHGRLPGSLADLPVQRAAGEYLRVRLDVAAGEAEIAIRTDRTVTVVGEPEAPEFEVMFRLP